MMRVNSLLPLDASERIRPSVEPVLSMKRQVRQTRQERIPLRVISNEEGQQHMGPLNDNSEQKEPSPQTPVLDGDEEEQRFRSIAALLARENSAVTLGKMMSSPALHYQGKVFAFYYGKKMVFRLGRDFQPELFNIQHYSLLAPFKTKPPMVDWFEIPSADQHRWEELSRYALQLLSKHEARL